MYVFYSLLYIVKSSTHVVPLLTAAFCATNAKFPPFSPTSLTIYVIYKQIRIWPKPAQNTITIIVL